AGGLVQRVLRAARTPVGSAAAARRRVAVPDCGGAHGDRIGAAADGRTGGIRSGTGDCLAAEDGARCRCRRGAWRRAAGHLDAGGWARPGEWAWWFRRLGGSTPGRAIPVERRGGAA